MLRGVIDPGDLRWIWLTHTDFDHIGSLATLLDVNPHVRVITSFLGVGIMGYAENLRASAALAAISSIPLAADGDTGYGNALNAYHTVRAFERAGVAGLMLEDQVWPKRCGHLAGKEVISAEEGAETESRGRVGGVEGPSDQDQEFLAAQPFLPIPADELPLVIANRATLRRNARAC